MALVAILNPAEKRSSAKINRMPLRITTTTPRLRWILKPKNRMYARVMRDVNPKFQRIFQALIPMKIDVSEAGEL